MAVEHSLSLPSPGRVISQDDLFIGALYSRKIDARSESERESQNSTAMKRSSSVPEIMTAGPSPLGLQTRRGISTSQISLPNDLVRPAPSLGGPMGGLDGSPRRGVSGDGGIPAISHIVLSIHSCILLL